MKRIVFCKSKGFSRVPTMDFNDDGNYFHVYLYKGLVPVSKLVASRWGDDGNIYADYRLDYLNIDYSEYGNLDEGKYNGIEKESFDMDDFTSIGNNIIAHFGEDRLKKLVEQEITF